MRRESSLVTIDKLLVFFIAFQTIFYNIHSNLLEIKSPTYLVNGNCGLTIWEHIIWLRIDVDKGVGGGEGGLGGGWVGGGGGVGGGGWVSRVWLVW